MATVVHVLQPSRHRNVTQPQPLKQRETGRDCALQHPHESMILILVRGDAGKEIGTDRQWGLIALKSNNNGNMGAIARERHPHGR